MIVLNVNGNRRVIQLSQLCYVEVYDHYLTYHTIDEDIRMKGTLADAKKELAHNGFFQCSRYMLVNIRYISAVNQKDIVVCGRIFDISRPRRRELIGLLLKPEVRSDDARMFYNTFRYPAELLAAELMFLPLLKRKAYFVPGTMIFFVSYFSAAYYFRYQNVAGMFDRTWVGLVIRYMLLIIISFVWMYFSFELDLYRSCFNIISACAVQYASLCVHRLGTLAVYSFSVMQEYYIAVQIVMELLVYTLIYFLFYRFFVCKIRQKKKLQKNWDVLLLSSGILVMSFFWIFIHSILIRFRSFMPALCLCFIVHRSFCFL